MEESNAKAHGGLNIVFDGPPSEPGRFVEVEDDSCPSATAGSCGSLEATAKTEKEKRNEQRQEIQHRRCL